MDPHQQVDGPRLCQSSFCPGIANSLPTSPLNEASSKRHPALKPRSSQGLVSVLQMIGAPVFVLYCTGTIKGGWEGKANNQGYHLYKASSSSLPLSSSRPLCLSHLCPSFRSNQHSVIAFRRFRQGGNSRKTLILSLFEGLIWKRFSAGVTMYVYVCALAS